MILGLILCLKYQSRDHLAQVVEIYFISWTQQFPYKLSKVEYEVLLNSRAQENTNSSRLAQFSSEFQSNPELLSFALLRIRVGR